MANYITVDGGTTNTRISLVLKGTVADTLFFSVGAGAGEDGRGRLRETVREGIREILQRNGMKESDIRRILASGMITSEFGLYMVPHLSVPAGLAELKRGSAETVLSDISEIPFVFMRGVKTEGETAEETDMMRGEETELMGLSESSPCVYMLMGSHTKIIRTDERGRIADFHTALTGELMAAVAGHTILKNAFSLEKTEVVPLYLLRGFTYAAEKGLGEALFKVRILRNLFDAAPEEAYSFCLGAVLQNDIRSAMGMGAGRIVVGGNRKLRDAVAILLRHSMAAEVVCLTDEEAKNAVAKGLVRIYEYGEE